MSTTRISKRQNILLLTLTTLAGFLANILFYDQEIGINYFIFLLAVYIIFFITNKKIINYQDIFAWFLTGTAILLAATLAIFTNPVFTWLNILLVPVLFGSSAIIFTRNNKVEWFDIRFVFQLFPRFFIKIIENSVKPFKILSAFKLNQSNGHLAVIKKVLWGVFISIPLLLLVSYLLASADEVFKSYLDSVPNWFENINISPQVVFVAFVTVLLSSFFWALLHRDIDPEKEEVYAVSATGETVVASTVLVLINLVYLLFIAIQFSYLFGGGDLSFLGDFTYAEYAVRGFTEIVLVSIINLSVTVAILQTTNYKSKAGKLIVKILLSVLVVLTACLLVSASYRLSLYEDAYGATYRRFFARTIMILLVLFFASSLYKIWKEKAYLLKMFITSALALFLVLNYINIDLIIARKNVQRFYETNDIDISYLSRLSDDVVAELRPLLGQNPELDNQISYYLSIKHTKLKNNQLYNWQAFNLSRSKAKPLLDKMFNN